MKLSAHLAALAMLACATPLRAGPGLWQIRVEVPVVSMPTGVALQLIPALRDPRQVEATVKNLQAQIARGEAALVAWPVVRTSIGQRGESEAIEEIRYPTEFDPPQVPQNFSTASPAPHRPTEWVPKAYETRNVGVTLEVTPTAIVDGTWIDLELNPLHTVFLGFNRLYASKAAWGPACIIDQPEFLTLKTTVSLSARSGEWKLLATFVVPKPEPHVELFLLRATAFSLAP